MTDADQAPISAAISIDQDRLWRRHMEFGAIGGTPKGGVNRQAFSAEDATVRKRMVDWATAIDCTVSTDAIGNLFVRRAGTQDELPPIMTGSHLDSQPTGGKFDGAYGVLAGMEVLEALHHAGIETRASIEVVAWSNEEGGRFQPGAMGSAVFVGKMDAADLMQLRDGDGMLLTDALAQTLAATTNLPQRKRETPAAYIEAHIEQGPILEAANLQIGIVTDIQGMRQFRVEITGEEAHAGTTPVKSRRDALMSATDMIGALEAFMADAQDKVRFTVGRFETKPGSPNTIPSYVFFTVDLRHPDPATLIRLGDGVEAICQTHVRGCEVTVEELYHIAPTHFDPDIVAALRASAAALNLPNLDMISGAGHDAMYLATLCPAAMIFVPCEKGISHNESENAKPEDLAAGTKLLAHALVSLANNE